MEHSKYLNLKTIVRDYNSTLAKSIRDRFSYDELMTSKTYICQDKESRFYGQLRGGNHRRIICTTSHKFDMKDGRSIKTIGVYLSPANEVTKRYPEIRFNMCSNHGMCDGLCLNTSGKMALSRNETVRIEKTLAFKGYPEKFCNQLLEEITDESRKANNRGDIVHARINGTSDQLWERSIFMDLFKACTSGFEKFYDYTKLSKRRIKGIPKSYHLTFSIDEKPRSMINALEYLKAGYSVAVVLHEKDKNQIVNLPGVVDGDLSDHRPLDPSSSIVVLKSKGKLRKSPVGLFVKSPDFIRAMVVNCMA